MLEVKLLGQFDVRLDGAPIEISARPAQSLLAYLILRPGAAIRREKLAGLLWPDAAEANARNNLRNALWRLRQALGTGPSPAGRDYFLADNLTLAFDADADFGVDVAVLEGARTAAEPAGNATADDLMASVSAYQGELLPGFYEEWVALERERLQAIFEHKMGLLLERLVAAERWPEARDWGEHWIALGSAPEPAYRALMVAHGELGDLSRVAAVYARCVETLQEQIGVEPSEQTRLLYEQLSKGGTKPGSTAAAIRTPEPAKPAVPEPPAPGEPPFKGLQHFDEADTARFFGRERLTADLLARLRPGRFLAVVGASGSGKSSIVRAGLIPALRRQSESPAPGWIVHLITPTAHPLEALAVSLTLDSESVTAATTLMDDLARESRSLHLAGQRLASRQTGQRLLLVVDQFEELFTLCRAEPERAAFLDNLLNAVDGEGPMALVITLRADFYAHCAPYPRLRDALEKYQAYIGPMSADELRRAIEEPATRAGWAFEPGLVDLLLQHVRDEPGALPLLSHALLETWQRRRGRSLTLGGYAETGGVGGAIAKTAQGVYEEMTAEQQAIARGIFLRLTELGEGTQDMRRRASLTELVSGPDGSPARRAATEAVLKTLADARLITMTEAAVEVSHEALIREWPTLREWLSESREALRLHRHLTEAAQAWDRLDRDPGELYRGARLAQALERARWADTQVDDLNVLEREFLLAAQEQAEREVAEREGQRRRELHAAQEIARAEQSRAEEQMRSGARLRTRNRILTVVGTIAIALALAAGFFGVQANQNALKSERQASLLLSRQLAQDASNLLNAKQYDLAGLLGVEAVRLADSAQARSALLAALQNFPPHPRTLALRPDAVSAVFFSRDGKTLAFGNNNGTIIFLDPVTGLSIGQPLTGHTGPVTDVTFSPDGRTLASGSDDGTVILWDVATHQPLGPPIKEPTGAGLITVAFSPDGRTLASGGPDNTVSLLDVASRQPIGRPLMGHTGLVNQVAFSPDGRTLASGSDDGAIILWDVATHQPLDLPLVSSKTAGVTTVAYSHDGKTLVSGSSDGTIILWDVATRRPIEQPLRGHTDWVSQVVFSPDDRIVASSSTDKTVRLWDVATLRPHGPPLTGHTDRVYSVAFSPDGNTVASGGSDGAVISWDVGTYQSVGQPLGRHAHDVTSVAYSPADGKTVAAADFGGTILLWDVSTHQSVDPPFVVHSGSVTSVAFNHDGNVLASGSQDSAIILWDAAAHQPLGPPLTGHNDQVNSVAFSPDGKILASGSRDGTARLWDVHSRQALGVPLTGHAGGVNTLAFSPDGKILVSGGQDRAIRLWNVGTGQPIGQPLKGQNAGVTSVAFSSDGKMLASGSYNGAILLWDIADPQPIGLPLIGHTEPVFSVAFSLDGKMLASAGQDKTVRLWDVATRQPIGQPLSGHTSAVNSLAFSPDGNTLASGSSDRTIWLWDVSVESWQARACAIVGRNLTLAEWAQYLPGQPYHKTCDQWPEGK